MEEWGFPTWPRSCPVGFEVRANRPAALSAEATRKVPMWREVIQRPKIGLL
jgi:hypothetical protein